MIRLSAYRLAGNGYCCVGVQHGAVTRS